jgi:sugar phosphate isomerase/epimerase
LKFGICSEIFQSWDDPQRAIHYAKEVGYDGLEVAPFTLAKRVTEISSKTRNDLVRWAEDADLDLLGIHWVLVGPDDVYINHPDRATRERTSQYLIDLVRFCGDIGGKVMIFGSPNQRNVVAPLTYDEAFEYTAQSFE